MVSCDSDVITVGDTTMLHSPIKDHLPCITSWPRDAPGAFFDAVWAAYFARVCVNRFSYAILLHRSETVADALRALSGERAFATQMGRTALLEVIAEARNIEWCKRELLDEVERYATYAFVLDGTRVTCGVV